MAGPAGEKHGNPPPKKVRKTLRGDVVGKKTKITGAKSLKGRLADAKAKVRKLERELNRDGTRKRKSSNYTPVNKNKTTTTTKKKNGKATGRHMDDIQGRSGPTSKHRGGPRRR